MDKGEEGCPGPTRGTIALSQTPMYTVRSHTDTGLMHDAVSVYSPAFTATHFA